MDAQSRTIQLPGRVKVTDIRDQNIQKILVGLRDPGDGDGQSLRRHQSARRARDRRVVNNWTDGGNRGLGLPQCFSNVGDGEDWTDAGDGIARSQNHGAGGHDGVYYAGRRFGVRGSGEANRFNWVLIPALHEIFLEAEIADRRVHPGLDARVTHRQDPRLYGELVADRRSGFGQRLSLRQEFGSQQVDGEVTVADVEPNGLGKLTHGLQAKECVTLYSPAALLAEQAGHRVGDRVQVGRDIQSPPFQIVSGVH